jgi:hypothetical protein
MGRAIRAFAFAAWPIGCALVGCALVGCALVGCAQGGPGRGDGEDSSVIRLRDSGTHSGFDAGVRRDSGTVIRRDSGGDPLPDAFRPRDSGGGSTCDESPCRLVSPQCGCAAGQGCYIGSAGTRICGTPGPEVEAEECTGETACRAGLLCLGAGDTGYCARFCESDAQCTAGPGSICVTELSDGAGGSIPDVTLCSIDCDPTSFVDCPFGAACTIYREAAGAMRYFTSCRPEGFGFPGDPCVTEEDCQYGHFCADAGLGRECLTWCTDDFDCDFSQLCNPFETPVTVGGIEYGFCY